MLHHDPLDLTNLTKLMQFSSGTPNVKIGLVDGPVSVEYLTFSVKTFEGLRMSQVIVRKSAAQRARTGHLWQVYYQPKEVI